MKRIGSLIVLPLLLCSVKLAATEPSGALSFIIETTMPETPAEKAIKTLDFISKAYDESEDFYQSGYMPQINHGSRTNPGFHGYFYMRPGQKVSSEFGYRRQFHRPHMGIDIAMHKGDTVRTPLAGVVETIGFDADGYGHYVIVRHGDGLETRYGHLEEPWVVKGQQLLKFQPLAPSGNSGNSTGPHLHLETRYMGVPVDPRTVFEFVYKPTKIK